MIGKTNGEQLRTFYLNGKTIKVEMSDLYKQESPYFLPPEGLTIINMDDPVNPTFERTTAHFNFSHNVYVEEDRPYL